MIKQVENAYKKFVDTLKQIEDLRLQLNKVNDDLTINEKKYEVGFISSLDLLKLSILLNASRMMYFPQFVMLFLPILN